MENKMEYTINESQIDAIESEIIAMERERCLHCPWYIEKRGNKVVLTARGKQSSDWVNEIVTRFHLTLSR